MAALIWFLSGVTVAGGVLSVLAIVLLRYRSRRPPPSRSLCGRWCAGDL